MRGPMITTARGAELLLAHVQALASDTQRNRPPQSRLSERVGPGLAGLLVYALRGDHGAPRSGLRI
jgi:hypothetical protein